MANFCGQAIFHAARSLKFGLEFGQMETLHITPGNASWNAEEKHCSMSTHGCHLGWYFYNKNKLHDSTCYDNDITSLGFLEIVCQKQEPFLGNIIPGVNP